MEDQDRKRDQHEIYNYLQSRGVYQLFEELMKALCINKPSSPIDFLIKKLEEPERNEFTKEEKRILIVGPPGFEIQKLALAIADSFKYSSGFQEEIHTFCMGDKIIKEHAKKYRLAQSIDRALTNFEFVSEDTAIYIVKGYLSKYESYKKSYIIEGFPMTMAQGLFLQRMNILPTAFLIINLSPERIVGCCLDKLNKSEFHKDIPNPQLLKLAYLHKTYYLLNINKVKELYAGTFYEIDATSSKSVESEQLFEDANRVLKFKIRSKAPKKPFKIIITGTPCSGRTTLGYALARKYGLVYVSTAYLISYEIGIKSPDGEKIKDAFLKGELVDEGTVMKLLKNRLDEKDCLLQGFVLEGYPKNATQLQYLENLKIQPTLFVVLNVSFDTAVERKKKRDRQTSEADIENLKHRIDRARDFLSYLETSYNSQLLKINANSSSQSIVYNVGFQLENL